MHMTERDKRKKGNAQSDVGAHLICYRTTAAFRRMYPILEGLEIKPKQAFRYPFYNVSGADVVLLLLCLFQ